MEVNLETARYKTVHDGQRVSFCSADCQRKFIADPYRFANHAPELRPNGVSSTVYTCPMHPEIRRMAPGSCPICGMGLSAAIISVEPRENAELADMTRRFWIGFALTLPVFVLEMGGHIAHLMLLPHRLSSVIQFVLSTPVVLWAGAPFFARGWHSFRALKLNMFSLIAIGIGTAWLFSVISLLFPTALPNVASGSHGAMPVYFESAAVITVLVLLGQVLEMRARERTSDAMRSLLNLVPQRARRVGDDGIEVDLALDKVRVGYKLRVRPGEKIPVDGEIIEGRGIIDESLLTGESLPVTKNVGAMVIAGSMNTTTSFVMRAGKVGSDTLLAHIVQLVALAQRSRASIQHLADKVSAWFVPAVLAVALLSALIWLIFGGEERGAFALLSAVSVLIIACPCALGLATPISIMVGIGRGARAGILIRDADALERMSKIDTLVVDKTGTLTEGHPSVTSIVTLPGIDQNELLRLTASAERVSEHPFALAIVRDAESKKLSLVEPNDFNSPIGQGIIALVDGKELVAGSRALLVENNVPVATLDAIAEKLHGSGATTILVGIEGAPVGVIAISDPIKPTAAEMVQQLQQNRIRIVLATGDGKATAAAIAAKLGIEHLHAEVLPNDKAKIVKALQRQSRIVAMAGDGVNDAPALATADVGIAMGTGTDVAIENSGITLLKGDLRGIVRARLLSKAIMRNIQQNLVFAFAYNVICIPVAAGALYPAFGILLSPVIAAAAMSLSSFSVIGNALRLRSLRL